MRIAIACAGIFLLLSSTSSAGAPPERGENLDQRTASPACGHTAELEEAKRALADGNREGALRHLRRAQTLVAACQRNSVEPEADSTTPAKAFAKASAPRGRGAS